MKVKNVHGYMLGNDNHVLMPGDQWWPTNELVWICRDVDTAHRIMEKSYHPLNDGVRWTTIYRVHADTLKCEFVSGDMLYTNDARRIIVDKPVAYYNPPRQLTEEILRARAALIAPKICGFLNKGKAK